MLRERPAAKDEFKSINGIKVLAKQVSVDNPAALRDIADQFREKIKSGVVVLGSVHQSKALLIALVTKDLVARFHAGKIVKQAASVVGGGGGGRPDMAQAGGKYPEKLQEALDSVYQMIKNS